MTAADEGKPLEFEQIVAAAVRALPSFLMQPPERVRVEEVEGPPDDSPAGDWRVTLSYLEPADPPPENPMVNSLLGPAGLFRAVPAPERVLRVIVLASTGRPKAMKRVANG